MKRNDILFDLICDMQSVDYNALVPIISCYTTDRRIGKYCLQKEHKVNHYEVKALPKQDLKYNSINYDKLISKKFSGAFMEFVDIILSEFGDANLTIFYNNINEVKTGSSKGYSFRYTDGYYDIEYNDIIFKEDNYLASIYHELFHMASSVSADNMYYSGFSQSSYVHTFGDGLNEGYTQLLTERYFGEIESVCGSYKYEMFIASKLEEIIGKPKMYKLYLGANLYGLIEELKQYSSYEEIINFMTCLDYIERYYDSGRIGRLLKTNSFIQKIKEVNSFLVKVYLIKLKKDVANGALNNDEMVVKFGQYIYSLLNDFSSKRFNYYNVCRDGIISDISNILDLVSDSERSIYKR